MYDEVPSSPKNYRLGETAMPVSPIEGALAELGKEISALEEYVGLLRARASRVATPAPPSMPCGKAECQSTGPHSATWHSITEAKERITSIGADIRELTSRLET